MQIHLGTRKGLFRIEKSGGEWRIASTEFLGIQVPMLLPDSRDGTLYAAVDHGHFGTKLHRSTRGGPWEELPPPAYPEKPAGIPDILDPGRQKPVPWSLEKIWSLEGGGFDEPGLLWCGTIPGGLFKSKNRGEDWELVRPLWDMPQRAKWFGGGYDFPGIHSICVDPRDPRHVLLAISCGGVWRTRDGGGTWAIAGTGLRNSYMPPGQEYDPDSQDPHRMVQCAADPDHLWIQHHNGIFRSCDAAQTWTEMTDVRPSSFGFAVAVHPCRPDTAWFVPAMVDEKRIPCEGKLVVTRTNDGGKTFRSLGRGLPDHQAYHLIYRHCLEIDSTGELLVMGSTTGGVWISENGGESWMCLSRDLPPVFCVRIQEK